jgi:hypothetical protein
MDLELARKDVAHALAALEASIVGLTNVLAHSNSEVQLDSPDGRGAIRRVCTAYSSIDYEMEDEVGSSVVCLGVVGVNTDILRRAAAVNDLKAKLKAVCAPLHGIQVRVAVKGEATPTRKISAARAILRSIQRSDLNLLAAYRKIPILETPPATITYTSAMTRAVYRKSVEDLYVLLNALEGPTASSDRARLSTLSPRETHLALVKDHYRNVRANVLYARLDSRGRGRVQIAAELPILYLQGRHSEPPMVQFPMANDLATEPRRIRESKLETKPFLLSIPVFRYIH